MTLNIRQALTKKWIAGSALSSLALLLAFLLSFLDWFGNLEFKIYDLRFSLRGAQPWATEDIVIVAIDEQSFADLPEVWPFPRHYYARMIDNLARAGASLIVFDVIFTEASQSNPQADAALAAAARRSGRVIFAGKIGIETVSNGAVAMNLIRPFPAILRAGRDWALVNIDEDQDGFIRRYLMQESIDDEGYLPLAMQAYAHLSGLDEAGIDPAQALKNGFARYEANSFLINYRGPARTFPTYSLSTVLDDRGFQLAGGLDTDSFENEFLPGRIFNNKIVFVGASAEELQDTKYSPFFSYQGGRKKLPGVEVHANALSTLLRNDPIRRSPMVMDLLLIILPALATMVLILRTSPFVGIALAALEVLVVVMLALVLFSFANFWMPVIGPMLAIMLSYVGNSVQIIVTERRERRRTKQVFQQYVAESVVNSILASGEKPKFGGEKRELTVLFSDIRGFTTYCEKHAPEVVVQRLNEYLTRMTDVVFRNQGTLDKFVGDEVMAVFGAPLHYPNHAEKACVTACQMITELRQLQKSWSEKNEDYFQIGIGVNTGTMIVGNLGAQQKFDYTVIGDEVNLGARLEGANKQYWTSIIISEFTYRRVRGRARVRELDLVRVKGKKKPVKIFELRSMEKLPEIEQDLIISVYTKGLTLYKQRRWYEALREFKRVLRYFPSDGPTRVYVERCLTFIAEPPPVDWDGVFEFKTK